MFNRLADISHGFYGSAYMGSGGCKGSFRETDCQTQFLSCLLRFDRKLREIIELASQAIAIETMAATATLPPLKLREVPSPTPPVPDLRRDPPNRRARAAVHQIQFERLNLVQIQFRSSPPSIKSG
ncbi:hypothetical protein LWI29_032498 [Acer saccharum]|uniref:Uncharacterized protein n=1 Tax=Acer saccharum TaxID=4024 RepID=A0AA39SY69_ACESA|nr:hypothetical protein LWI29_032498 [Acer saccharum]